MLDMLLEGFVKVVSKVGERTVFTLLILVLTISMGIFIFQTGSKFVVDTFNQIEVEYEKINPLLEFNP